MASGCTTGGSGSAAVLFQKLTPDTMVQYTGPAIPQFGICTGDLLSEVEAVILQQIINYSTAVGITVPSIDLTTCACFQQSVGCCGASSCISLTCILQAYLQCMCELYADVVNLQAAVTMIEGPYNTMCLANVTSASQFSDIFQEVITELCTAESNISSLQTQLTTLISNLPTTIGNFLNSAISTCGTGSDSVIKSGTGASFQLQILGTVPIGGIIMYNNGNPAWFDSSGLGYPGGPACGWAYCNGRNGTIDMRNQFPVGMTNMAGNSGLKSNDTTSAYGSPVSIGGEAKHLLTTAEIPPAAISGSTAAGTGTLGFYTVSRKHASTGDNTMGYQCDGSGTSTPCPSSPNRTISFSIPGQTLSGNVAGGGQAHENRPPYTPLIFIQRVS